MLFNKNPAVSSKDLIYAPPMPERQEQRDIEKAFARCFSTESGRQVLAHLQVMTFQRALGPEAPDSQIRYLEGQRAMVGSILRMIDRGRNGK